MFGFEGFHLLYISRPTLGQTPSKICIFHNMWWQLPAHVTFWKNILETSSQKQKRTNTASCGRLHALLHCWRGPRPQQSLSSWFPRKIWQRSEFLSKLQEMLSQDPKNTDDALRQKKEKIENEESYIFEPELHRVVVLVVIPYTSKSSAHKDGTLPMRNNGNFN